MSAIHAKRQAALKAAQAIIENVKARGGDLTDQEVSQVEALHEEIKAADATIARVGGQKSVLDSIAEMAGTQGEEQTGNRYLSLKAGYSDQVVRKMSATGPDGAKGLAGAGVVLTEVPLVNTLPIVLGRPLTSVIDSLPVVQRAASYDYLRQATRTNNAATVAPGGTKPTTLMGLERVPSRLRVVAHLSEKIGKYLLEDNANLATFVDTELTGGLLQTIEAQVVGGNGTGENMTGILNTSGIQTVTAGADGITTLRKAITALESAGYVPGTFVVNATDWQTIETKRNASGEFDLGGPIDAATRRAWGVPVALSGNVPAGTALLLGVGAVNLASDLQGIRTEWDASGGFATNEVQARNEGRFNVEVVKPAATAKITLPATL
jgi:HK97 family phage major capsid protein